MTHMDPKAAPEDSSATNLERLFLSDSKSVFHGLIMLI